MGSHSTLRPDAGLADTLPRKSEQMSVMLVPEWSAAAGAIIEESLVRYSLYASQARRLGSKLMTDSFFENVMIQQLHHRWSL